MKKEIKFFVSYARANRRLANTFLQKFKEQVAPSRKYQYEMWQDSDVFVGEEWHHEILQAVKDCHVGIILISPAFLGSNYIDEHELPKFVGDNAKPIIPIMLQSVDLERHDLKGLQHRQIFRLDSDRFQHPKAFGDCTGRQRDRFINALFRQVEFRLDKLFP